MHHEFGYYFGYHRSRNFSAQPRIVGKRLRYFLDREEVQHPGMYQHFQGFPVDGFDDPVTIARVVAEEIGKAFKEPKNPEELRIGQSRWTAIPPEGFEELAIKRTSSSAAPDYAYGIVTIDVSAPKPIFNVSVAVWHPQVSVSLLNQVTQIGGGQKQQLSLRVDWAEGAEPKQEVQDSHDRRFPLHRPRDPGSPWAPLYVTFETQSEQYWAAVTYMRVERQQHGHPETQLLAGPNPYGWVRGHTQGI